MKKFLIVIAAAIFILVVVGTLYSSSESTVLKNGVSIGLILFTFIWTPVFLFYAYDRRQSRKESENLDEE